MEVQKAVELGYKILETYEVWHYTEQSQYDKEKGEDDLFSKIHIHISRFKTRSKWLSWIGCWWKNSKENTGIRYEEREGVTPKTRTHCIQ